MVNPLHGNAPMWEFDARCVIFTPEPLLWPMSLTLSKSGAGGSIRETGSNKGYFEPHKAIHNSAPAGPSEQLRFPGIELALGRVLNQVRSARPGLVIHAYPGCSHDLGFSWTALAEPRTVNRLSRRISKSGQRWKGRIHPA